MERKEKKEILELDNFKKENKERTKKSKGRKMCDAHQGAGHADHTSGNGAEFAQDPLSFPSGPITRLRAKRFKEALNGSTRSWGSKPSLLSGFITIVGEVHINVLN